MPRPPALLLRSAAVLVAGFALTTAYEPLTWWWIAPLAVAGCVLAIRGSSLRAGAWLGWLFSAAHWSSLIWWMRAVGPDAYGALAGFMSTYGIVFGIGIALVGRLRWWPLWTAVMWLACEALRGAWPFGGFPWARLAFATIDSPLAPGLAWFGANGVSLLVALLGTGLAAVVVSTRRRRALAGVLVVAGVALVPSVVTVEQTDAAGQVTVAVVQGDVPGSGDDVARHHRLITAAFSQLTQELAGRVSAGEEAAPDFVLWSENSTAVDPFTDPIAHDQVVDAVAAVGVPVLVGAMVDAPSPEHVLNQGVVWDPRTGPGDRYTKHHPVPFGEYIPYRNRVDLTKNFGKLRLIPNDMLSGTRTAPLRIGEALVAEAICFDIAYDDELVFQVGAGAQLVVVQTSNAMFIRTHQIEQQWAISRLRAIETGRYVVVAAINGVSGVIAPDGSVVAKIPTRTAATLVQEVSLRDGSTTGLWVGPWLGRAAAGVAVGSALVGLLAYRRRSTIPLQTQESA